MRKNDAANYFKQQNAKNWCTRKKYGLQYLRISISGIAGILFLVHFIFAYFVFSLLFFTIISII